MSSCDAGMPYLLQLTQCSTPLVTILLLFFLKAKIQIVKNIVKEEYHESIRPQLVDSSSEEL